MSANHTLSSAKRIALDDVRMLLGGNLLGKLQRDNNAKFRRLIRQPLERYFLTTHSLIDQAVSKEERFCVHFASMGRLLLGFENTAILLSAKRTTQPRQMRIHFFPSLIHDVISQKKFFLGIDFQRLQKLRQRTDV